MNWWRIASLSGALSVFLGAFGAHGLKNYVQDPYLIEVWNKGVLYQFIHTFALLFNATSPRPSDNAASAFLFGICVFSGSLYAITLTKIKWLGAITPIGGLSFILGWLLMAFS
eukprot:TRINITY_DN9695_c0_g1_i5.p1 TRINITY_DN9695_c0_g1~~TRINITY_DN9695_c0_g1_i5.p1  ORF type:complete len:113 (-),score=12.38 TRINITY_DN9695_c0_g1_i5:60-398(-)